MSAKTIPCKCGGTMCEIVDVVSIPMVRKGWYCFKCHAWIEPTVEGRVIQGGER